MNNYYAVHLYECLCISYVKDQIRIYCSMYLKELIMAIF
jgi:hypothetical protein